jgi:BON domain
MNHPTVESVMTAPAITTTPHPTPASKHMTTVGAEVSDGVVTLIGRLDRHREVIRATRVTRALPGVVDVVNALTYDLDNVEGGTA